MKREQFDLGRGYDQVDIVAAWPVSAQVAPLPISELEALVDVRPQYSAPAAPDVPAAVGGLIAASYAALIAALAWATAGSPSGGDSAVPAPLSAAATTSAARARRGPRRG